MKSLKKLPILPILLLSLSLFLGGCGKQISDSVSRSDVDTSESGDIIAVDGALPDDNDRPNISENTLPEDGAFVPAANPEAEPAEADNAETTPTETEPAEAGPTETEPPKANATGTEPAETKPAQNITPAPPAAFSLSAVPAYSGNPSAAINGNIPYFTEEDITTEPFEIYSPLDSKNRCGVAFANICKELMPSEERRSIGHIRPSGWHTVNYHKLVDGNYLYNRCHLIAHSLAGENDNVQNLITGTRYMNKDGMLPYENKVKDYVLRTNHHVLYRVTPIFEGDNLVATGVLMEAKSVEDNRLSFCVFCYNVQPNITIDYLTGDSVANIVPTPDPAPAQTPEDPGETASSQAESRTYILNTNTDKFHYPSCRSVNQMADHNKSEFTGTRDEIIAQGYSPCGNCHP